MSKANLTSVGSLSGNFIPEGSASPCEKRLHKRFTFDPSLSPRQEGATASFRNSPKGELLYVAIFLANVLEQHSNIYRLFFTLLLIWHKQHSPPAYFSSSHSPLECSDNVMLMKLSQKEMTWVIHHLASLQVRAEIQTLSSNGKLGREVGIYLKSDNEIRLLPTSQRVIISIPTSQISLSSLPCISGSGSPYSFTHE